MNNKGNMVAVVAFELVVTFFIVLIFFTTLDKPITEDILGAAQADPGIDPAWNETISNFQTSWDAVPWIMLAGGVLSLFVVALAYGR